MSLPEGTYQLTASSIRYAPSEQTVTVIAGGTGTVNFLLSGGTQQLEEIAVTYGKQACREITGAVTTVDATELQEMPAVQFGQQLQGK